jgi:hypothetical protein
MLISMSSASSSASILNAVSSRSRRFSSALLILAVDCPLDGRQAPLEARGRHRIRQPLGATKRWLNEQDAGRSAAE